MESYNEIVLRPGQVKMVQIICEYALPAVLGLNVINNPTILNQ